MASIESIVQAFAYGLARGLMADGFGHSPPVRQGGPRRRRAHSQRSAAPSPPNPPTIPQQMDMLRRDGITTQAELDRMEAILKGEMPSDLYMPGEGVPVTGPNG